MALLGMLSALQLQVQQPRLMEKLVSAQDVTLLIGQCLRL